MARDPQLQEAKRREKLCRERLSPDLFDEYINCDKKRIRKSLRNLILFILIGIALGAASIYSVKNTEKKHIQSYGAAERFVVRKKDHGHQIITDVTAKNGKTYHLDTRELGIKDLEEEYRYKMRFVFYVKDNGKIVKFTSEDKDDMPDVGASALYLLSGCALIAVLGSSVCCALASCCGRDGRRQANLYLYAVTRNPVLLQENFRAKDYLSKEQKSHLRKLRIRSYLHLPLVLAGSWAAVISGEAGNARFYFLGLGFTILGAIGLVRLIGKQESFIESCFAAGARQEPEEGIESRM